MCRTSKGVLDKRAFIYVVYHYSRAKRASAEVVYNVNQTRASLAILVVCKIPLLARLTRRATIGYLVYNDFGVLLKGGS